MSLLIQIPSGVFKLYGLKVDDAIIHTLKGFYIVKIFPCISEEFSIPTLFNSDTIYFDNQTFPFLSKIKNQSKSTCAINFNLSILEGFFPTSLGLKFNKDFYASPIDWMASLKRQLSGSTIQVGCILPIYLFDSLILFKVDLISSHQTTNSSECNPLESLDQTTLYFIDPKETHFHIENHIEKPHHSLILHDQEFEHLKFLLSHTNSSEVFKGLNLLVPFTITINAPSGYGKHVLLSQILHHFKLKSFSLNIQDMLSYFENLDEDNVYSPLDQLTEKAILSSPSAIILENFDLLQIHHDIKSNITYHDKLNHSKTIHCIIDSCFKVYREKIPICFIAISQNETKVKGLSDVNLFVHTVTVGSLTIDSRKLLINHLLNQSPQYQPNQSNQDHSLNHNTSNQSNQDHSLNHNTSNQSNQDHSLNQIQSNQEHLYSLNIDSLSLQLSQLTNGFSARDITSLISQAYQMTDSKIPNSIESYKNILQTFKPSTTNLTYYTPRPLAYQNEIYGYESIRNEIMNMIVWPFKHSLKYSRLGIEPRRGLLLHGPTGCGKTTLVRSIVASLSYQYMEIKSTLIHSPYFGQSESNIRDVFRSAKESQPCILLFDDIDVMGHKRGTESDVSDKLLSTLLNEMDGLESRGLVFVIGCTNRIESVDEALLRPGRLDVHINVGLPDSKERKMLLLKYLNDDIMDKGIDLLVDRIKGVSCADIKALISDASILAISRGISKLNLNLLEEVINKM